MKFKKITAVTLIIITLLSALALTVTAEESKTSVIPEGIPTEGVDLDIEYSVYVGVKPFEEGRDFAIAPFSRFYAAEDGKTVALTFPSDGGTAVAVFTVRDGKLELTRGFDVAFSETAIVRLQGDNVLVWLKESGVTFAVNGKGEITELKKLSEKGETENGENTALAAAQAFFGDGISELTAENGIRFSPAAPITANGSTVYTKLIRTNADGTETVLYDASAFPALRVPTVAIMGAVALVIAVAIAATEIAYLKKKRIDSNEDKV